jgi:hypothetical protein
MPALPTSSTPTLSQPPTATTDLRGDAIAQAEQLDDALESWIRWAAEPIASAELLVDELCEWAMRAQIDGASLRTLTKFVLGEADRRTIDDRRLQARADVQRMLARVRRVGAALREVEGRAKVASRHALALAMRAPVVAAEAARLLARTGRHRELSTVASLPHRIKRRADEIRSEAMTFAARADQLIDQLGASLFVGLVPRASSLRRLPRTDRLRAVGS